MKLKAIAEQICWELKIKTPKIEVGIIEKGAGTVRACFLSRGYKVVLKKDEGSLEYIFALAHELRRAWQYKNDRGMFRTLKPIGECKTREEFFLQDAEVDANAYAAIILSRMGFEPVFDGMPKEARERVQKRMGEIESENKTQNEK